MIINEYSSYRNIFSVNKLLNATVQMCCSTPEPIPRMMSSISLQKQDSDASSSIRGEYVCCCFLRKNLKRNVLLKPPPSVSSWVEILTAKGHNI